MHVQCDVTISATANIPLRADQSATAMIECDRVKENMFWVVSGRGWPRDCA